jgi:ParB/RepB/Spo0J family partition protein
MTIETNNGEMMELRSLDLAEISPWCRNPRKTFQEEALGDLTASVRRMGVQTPIKVRATSGWLGDDEVATEYVIIFGERRYRAAKLAGLTTIPVLISSVTSEAEAFEVAMLENLDRDDLDVFEAAAAYQVMMGFGYSVAELAARFKKDRRVIGRQLELLKLNAAERAELLAGTIAVQTAVEILKIADPDSRASALAEVVHPKYQTDPLSRDAAVRLVRDRFVRPEAEARAWEDRREGLARKHPGVEILTYEESREVAQMASIYAFFDAKPLRTFRFLCWVSEDPQLDERPTWGQLATRYGAGYLLAAPVEPEGEPRMVVEWKPLYEADLEHGLGEDAVFQKRPQSEEGKAARVEAERAAEGSSARGRLLEAEKRSVITQLTGGTLAVVLPFYVEEFLGSVYGLDKVSAVYEFCHFAEEADAEEAADWFRQLVRKRGVEAWAWLAVAREVIDKADDDLHTYALAVGGVEEFPVILGSGEDEKSTPIK